MRICRKDLSRLYQKFRNLKARRNFLLLSKPRDQKLIFKKSDSEFWRYWAKLWNKMSRWANSRRFQSSQRMLWKKSFTKLVIKSMSYRWNWESCKEATLTTVERQLVFLSCRDSTVPFHTIMWKWDFLTMRSHPIQLMMFRLLCSLNVKRGWIWKKNLQIVSSRSSLCKFKMRHSSERVGISKRSTWMRKEVIKENWWKIILQLVHKMMGWWREWMICRMKILVLSLK